MAKPKLLDYTAEELPQKVDKYFQLIDSGAITRGAPADLLRYIGISWETARSICNTPPEDYKRHSAVLLEAANRIRAHLEVHSGWSTNNSSKAMFMLKQPLWDNMAYKDKQEVESNTNATINVNFGTGKDANKAFD